MEAKGYKGSYLREAGGTGGLNKSGGLRCALSPVWDRPLWMEQITFFGHDLTGDGVHLNEKKVPRKSTPRSLRVVLKCCHSLPRTVLS